MSKQNTNANLAQLISSLQGRITSTSDRARKTADALAAHQDYTKVEIDRVEELVGETITEVETLGQGLAKNGQDIRDNAAGTTKAIVALKDATQAAFDGMSKDFEAADKAIQRMNARISSLEGAAKNAVNTSSALEIELKALLTRFGYNVGSVTIGKTTYTPINLNGVSFQNSGLSSLNSGNVSSLNSGNVTIQRGSEGIDIKITGTKSL